MTFPFSPTLVARLENDATVASIAGTRIYPLQLPQDTYRDNDNDAGAGFAALTYEMLDEEIGQSMSRNVGFRRVEYDISAFSATFAEADALAEAVYASLSRWTSAPSGVQDVFPFDLDTDYDDATELYRISRTYEVIINE